MEQYNFKISIDKTKILAFRGLDTIRAKIVLKDKILEQVNCFNYLGCNVSYNKNEDLIIKINRFNYMCGTIRRYLKNTRTETKLKFYKMMAVPVLLYGSEFWTLTKKKEKMIETAEMRLLRNIAGYTRLDRKRNEDIRKQLNIFKLTDKIEIYRRKWIEHVQRMPEDRIPKIITNYKPTGKRNVGRPRKRWNEQF